MDICKNYSYLYSSLQIELVSLKILMDRGIDYIHHYRTVIGRTVARKLYDLKTDIKNKLYSQSTFFEDLGYRYMGPVDGHNIENLCDALETAKNIN